MVPFSYLLASRLGEDMVFMAVLGERPGLSPPLLLLVETRLSVVSLRLIPLPPFCTSPGVW